MRKKIKKAGDRRSRPRLGRAELGAMVAEAIVDCYNEEEQVSGFFTMIDDSLAVPFETSVLGMIVTVERVDLRGR